MFYWKVTASCKHSDYEQRYVKWQTQTYLLGAFSRLLIGFRLHVENLHTVEHYFFAAS